MVNWNRFDPAAYDFEFNEDKLAAHGVNSYEAAEVFWNGCMVYRNKGARDRYQIVGCADSGRALKLIIQLSGKTIRVITGWPI